MGFFEIEPRRPLLVPTPRGVRLDGSATKRGPVGPRGPQGVGADGAVQVAMSQQAGTAMRVGVDTGTVGLLVIADSKGAGTGLTNYADRWQNRLLALMRARFPVAGGDAMRGLVPANMTDPYAAMSGRPTTTGTTYPVDTAGLGYNTLQLELGSTVTWPAATWPAASTLPIGYHTHSGANGTLEVLVDGVVQTEINCSGTGEGEPLRTSIPIAAGTHTVSMRPKAGTAPVRVMYAEQRSAATGWHLYDASRPGLAARHVVAGPAGAAQGDESFAKAVADLPSVRLAVVALGANDMTISTPAQYGSDIRAVVDMVKAGHPTTGVVVVLPAALTDDSAVVDDVQAYHTAARAALVDVPDLSILAETQLVDTTGPNAGAWLADSVHPNELGHDLISRALAGSLIGLDGPTDALSLVEDAIAPAVADAQAAQSAAQSSAADADAAVLLAQQAQAAALEVPDANTAAMIGNPATDTSAALEAKYRPAARSPITGWYHADRFGAGTVTAASLQAAVDAAAQSMAQTGQGGTVYIPDPPPGSSWTIAATINLRSRVTIKGNNRTKTAVKSGASVDQQASHVLLEGPGAGAPLFQIGTNYPVGADSLAAADTVIDGISAANVEAPVVRNYAGLNFRIVNSELRSFYAAEDATNGVHTSPTAAPIQSTIELRYAYRGVIEQSSIGCVRGWCIDARDNVNGIAIRDNIISGGSLGGAVSLNLATAVTIENNVIESSRDGIRCGTAGYAPYSAGDETLYKNPAGRVHNIHIRGNYLENCSRYISFPYQEANGCVIEGNYLGGGLSRPIMPEYGILAGRLNGCVIKGNSWHSIGSEPFLKVAYVTGGTVVAPVNCEIGPNHLAPLAGTPVIYDTTAYPNVIQRAQFAGRNTIWVTQPTTAATPLVTGHREWTSAVMTANVSSPLIALQTAAQAGWGAGLISVEIIGATGTLTGAKVQLGSPVSAAESADVAIDGLTYTYGAALVDLTAKFTRADTAQPLLVRAIAGTGTGSFQVRVKWRGL